MPEWLDEGPLASVRYGIEIFVCHVGVALLPCAYFLVRALVKQRRWVERLKLGVLAGVCLWFGLANAREVYWFWRGFFE